MSLPRPRPPGKGSGKGEPATVTAFPSHLTLGTQQDEDRAAAAGCGQTATEEELFQPQSSNRALRVGATLGYNYAPYSSLSGVTQYKWALNTSPTSEIHPVLLLKFFPSNIRLVMPSSFQYLSVDSFPVSDTGKCKDAKTDWTRPWPSWSSG
ncbi:ADP-ribosylation factor-like protein 11 isoform X2 [Panthera uncia]|uniref:ADP-ribosylation factor-like protein 11 isoform X2 n=1 Tax=Panthera uncia TaxID=29064 RepID=UPI0020FFC513|nr:ADP-ribosylation factor-like protein 11 isoform X2 [Panthera uncia]